MWYISEKYNVHTALSRQVLVLNFHIYIYLLFTKSASLEYNEFDNLDAYADEEEQEHEHTELKRKYKTIMEQLGN